MDCFKLARGSNFIHPITLEMYLRLTQKRKPYCLKDEKGGEHFYAVCPECENPIQIIGLFRNTAESGRKPYGKHCKGDISGLAEYIEENYLYCPYSNPQWKKPKSKRSPGSQFSKDVLRLMYEQYDKVVAELARDMEIHISVPLARTMLINFLNHEAWCYRMATLNNLPWILGETQPSTSLYGQWFIKGSKLQKAIEENCPAAQFKETEYSRYLQLLHKPGSFLDICVYFLKHEKKLHGEHHLTESIDFEVTCDKKSIYYKTIEIKTNDFVNSLSNKTYRNGKYLSMAQELIDVALFE